MKLSELNNEPRYVNYGSLNVDVNNLIVQFNGRDIRISEVDLSFIRALSSGEQMTSSQIVNKLASLAGVEYSINSIPAQIWKINDRFKPDKIILSKNGKSGWFRLV